MASEADAASETFSLLERLINSRNRDLSMFVPFIIGLTNNAPRRNGEDSDEDESPENNNTPPSATHRDRIILINPFTQGMIVIGGTSSLDSLFQELSNKGGQPPASKSSIEALPEVDIGDGDVGECAICLEEWKVSGKVKEMPCKHRFHGECIEKWLGIHGSCPVCRHKMPIEEESGGKKRDSSEDGDDDEEGDDDDNGGSRRRIDREIWVSFSFNGNGNGNGNRRGDSTQTTDSSDS